MHKIVDRLNSARDTAEAEGLLKSWTKEITAQQGLGTPPGYRGSPRADLHPPETGGYRRHIGALSR